VQARTLLTGMQRAIAFIGGGASWHKDRFTALVSHTGPPCAHAAGVVIDVREAVARIAPVSSSPSDLAARIGGEQRCARSAFTSIDFRFSGLVSRPTAMIQGRPDAESSRVIRIAIAR